jgi:hypothetical protein
MLRAIKTKAFAFTEFDDSLTQASDISMTKYSPNSLNKSVSMTIPFNGLTSQKSHESLTRR